MEWKTIQVSGKNIRESVLVTLVADNINWKNKTLKGRETHNTNSILIQQEYVTEHTSQSNVTLTPDYKFDRKCHGSCKRFM